MFVSERETVTQDVEAEFPSGASLQTVTGPTGPSEEHWDPNNTGLPLYETGPAVHALRLSKNFTVKELVSSGGRPATKARISPDLVRCLQAIRDAAGKPVTITSGYRSWWRNVEVYKGRTPTRSRHCSGQAADITIPGLTGLQIAKLAVDACGDTLGIGVGRTFAHVDVRGTRASWTYFEGEEDGRALEQLEEHRRRRRPRTPPSEQRPPRQERRRRDRGRTPPRPAPARSTNLVLISGGPGLFDNRDVEHDRSWANYVTPPLLLTDTPAKKKAFVGSATDVTWLIYKPAYIHRFVDDLAHVRSGSADVLKDGFASYVDKLEKRAQGRGWRLRWFDSEADLWKRLGTFQDPIAQVIYWGHARDDLWLSLAHSSSSRAVAPTRPGSVVRVSSIKANAKLKSSFVGGRPHRFVGCNTAAFAAEWSRTFGVVAEGVKGKVDFSAIHSGGGHPALVGTSTWKSFGTRTRVP